MDNGLPDVGAVLGWGALSSIGLVLGAIVGCFFRLSHRRIASAMSVGAGLLLAAASVGIAADVVRVVGAVPAVASVLLGAALVSGANALLARSGARHRKRCGECTQQASESQQPGSGVAIALGTALDAVPEAMVLGLALRERAVPIELMIAISVGNLPEALSGAAGMRAAGRGHRYVLVLWSAIAIGATVATAASFTAFGSLDRSWAPHVQALGAGALLAMTAETMIPEAFHNGPRFSGFLAAFGFCVALLLDAATR